MKISRALGFVLVLAAVMYSCGGAAEGPRADLILDNGKIITVDDEFSVVEALAVHDGRILVAGTNRQVEAFAGPSTRRVDLRGYTVTPGFIDGHPHVFGMRDISLEDVTSVGDILEVISAQAASAEPGEWIICEPPGEPPFHINIPDSLEEGRYPTREELDQAAPENPVYVKSSAFHEEPKSLFNSLGLERLGITRASGPIEGVEIVRLADGTPTGEVIGNLSYFSRSPLRDQLWRLAPRPPFSARLEQLKKDIHRYNAGGVTAVYEGHGMSDDVIALYNELWNRGDLTLRTYLVKSLNSFMPIEAIEEELDRMAAFRGPGFGDHLLRIGGICMIFGDNVGFGAGFMREPYIGPYGEKWTGLQLIPDEKLYQIARAAAHRNIRVNAQASGGRAIDIVLEAYDRVHSEIAIDDRRFVIEHCQFPSIQNMNDVVRLGVIPTTCTNFLWGQGNAYLRFYGKELANQAIPLKTWIEQGVPVVQSSDYGPDDAMFTLWQSIARRNGWTGEVLGPQESITREQAIRIYTINGARLAFWEDHIGSLEPGKYADLVVLDRDILTCELDDIRTTKVLATLLAGKEVYGSLDEL